MASSTTDSTPPATILTADVEKTEKITPAVSVTQEVELGEGRSSQLSGTMGKIWKFLGASGVEMRGVEPVPVELRTDSAFNKIFSIWCTSLLCPLP